MRRAVVVALVALAFAPAARAGCGVTSSALAGRAPLTVTMTAQCASQSYTWAFGDGQTATGQTVQQFEVPVLYTWDQRQRKRSIGGFRIARLQQLPGGRVLIQNLLRPGALRR